VPSVRHVSAVRSAASVLIAPLAPTAVSVVKADVKGVARGVANSAHAAMVDPTTVVAIGRSETTGRVTIAVETPAQVMNVHGIRSIVPADRMLSRRFPREIPPQPVLECLRISLPPRVPLEMSGRSRGAAEDGVIEEIAQTWRRRPSLVKKPRRAKRPKPRRCGWRNQERATRLPSGPLPMRLSLRLRLRLRLWL